MDGYCDIDSTNPDINMYDREAVPLTVATRTATTYSSPIHSPTSSVPAVTVVSHASTNDVYSHRGSSISGAHSTTPSASASALIHQGHTKEQISPTPLSNPSRHQSPQVAESTSPTEGIGMLDTVDDSAISSEGGSLGQVDSSNPKQAFVPCKVCGDKASGYHYGVTSCEGCKGFFRRSIQKQIEYRCLRDGKCLVIRLNRNRCQYCRFKKCLAVGMSRDLLGKAVRYGRVPKRSKSLDQQQPNSTTTEQQDQAEQESRQLAIYDVILTVSQAHHCNCLTTEDKAKHIIKRNRSLMPLKQEQLGNGMISTMEMLEQHRCLMFQGVTELLTPSIQNVVEFAKRVPGFPDLAQDDQLVLIKSSYKEVWLTHLARQFDLEHGTMMFSDGSVVARSQLEIVYNPEIISGMFRYAQSFSLLGLNDTEIGLYTAIVINTPDRPGLGVPKSVERIQERLIEALKLQLTRNHAAETSLFTTVMMKVPELRGLGSQHNDLLDWFRHRWQRLSLPPLYAEIFDIPKSEEDLQVP